MAFLNPPSAPLFQRGGTGGFLQMPFSKRKKLLGNKAAFFKKLKFYPKSISLRVRDQPLYIPGIPFIHDDVFAQFSLPLGCLAGKKMAGIGLGTFDLSAPGQLETFGCSSFCL
jgi:hypothetical protein